MRIIRNIEEFKTAIQTPNPSEIYALIPLGYEVLSEEPAKILQNRMDCLVYGDIEISNGVESVFKFNPSFDPEIITKGFALDSPIFLKTSKPLMSNQNELNHLVLDLLQQIIGIHIAEPIFKWNQKFDV